MNVFVAQERTRDLGTELGPDDEVTIKQALPDYKERSATAQAEEKKKPRKQREFEREFGAEAEERPPMPVDASLEAILKELKERGIGRR
jgi:hypothetical protein